MKKMITAALAACAMLGVQACNGTKPEPKNMYHHNDDKQKNKDKPDDDRKSNQNPRNY